AWDRRDLCAAGDAVRGQRRLQRRRRAHYRAADHAREGAAGADGAGKGNSGGERRMKKLVRLRVNGWEQEVAVGTHHTLLDVLRREFKLFSVREGCGIGMCGACTVLIDGKPISSCLALAPLAAGKEVTTVESLGQEE